MLAGGGNVKIKNYPKGVTVTAPKVDVRDNFKHTPGGGNVKVSTPINTKNCSIHLFIYLFCVCVYAPTQLHRF